MWKKMNFSTVWHPCPYGLFMRTSPQRVDYIKLEILIYDMFHLFFDMEINIWWGFIFLTIGCALYVHTPLLGRFVRMYSQVCYYLIAYFLPIILFFQCAVSIKHGCLHMFGSRSFSKKVIVLLCGWSSHRLIVNFSASKNYARVFSDKFINVVVFQKRKTMI